MKKQELKSRATQMRKMGMSNKDISRQLGVSEKDVTRALGDDRSV